MVTTHDLVQQPALRLQEVHGFERIHDLILGGVGVGLAVLMAVLWRHVAGHPARRRLMASGGVLLVWSGAVVTLFMLRSIEIIHFVQYLVLAMALIGLLRAPIGAVLLAVAAGIGDEAWQFFHLHPWQPYFDFNDVVMNATGALQGAWLWAVLRPDTDLTPPNRTSQAWAHWGAAWGLVAFLFVVDVIHVYQTEDVATAALMRRPPPGGDVAPVQWVQQNNFGKTWVLLHPIAGMWITALLPLGVLGVPFGHVPMARGPATDPNPGMTPEVEV
jgi:hypothetical protein